MNRENIVLSGRNIVREFGFGKNKVAAVNNVGFDFYESEIISLVGESGSGKSTLAKIIMGLLKPDSGDLLYCGKPLDLRTHRKKKHYWQQVQAVFQDPFSSFNQFFKIERLFRDCLKLKNIKANKKEEKELFTRACSFVNLQYKELEDKYPFELSGGQMQRLMIARIFLINPTILIADEPTSMIDACTRSTILDMLLDLREENKMTILFITHDLGLAYYVSDTIYIMEQGEIVEGDEARTIIENPSSEYTRHLINDVPKLHETWLEE